MYSLHHSLFEVNKPLIKSSRLMSTDVYTFNLLLAYFLPTESWLCW